MTWEELAAAAETAARDMEHGGNTHAANGLRERAVEYRKMAELSSNRQDDSTLDLKPIEPER